MLKSVCVIVVLIHISTQTTQFWTGADLRNAFDHDTGRIQRSLFGIAKDAIVGFRAKAKLLKGLKLDRKLVSSQRIYTKMGTYADAVSDFRSVGPTNVREYTLPGGSKGMIGAVGDRTLTIRKSAVDNKGSLTISRNGGKDYVIRYQF